MAGGEGEQGTFSGNCSAVVFSTFPFLEVCDTDGLVSDGVEVGSVLTFCSFLRQDGGWYRGGLTTFGFPCF